MSYQNPTIQSNLLKIFLCHASEDKDIVRNLAEKLRADHFEPWLDVEQILPGQNWENEIRKAIQESDAILICLSKKAVSKSGYLQKELEIVLDIAEKRAADSIFLIPARLEECKVPKRLNSLQWVDLYQFGGYQKLLKALHEKANQLSQASSGVAPTTRIWDKFPRWVKSKAAVLLSIITILATIVGFGADALDIVETLFGGRSTPAQVAAVDYTPIPPAERDVYEALYKDAVENWQNVYEDDFSEDNGVWGNGDFSDDAWSIKKHLIEDDLYRTIATPAGDSKGWIPANLPPVSDFSVSVDTQLINGTAGLNEYGLIFRFRNGQDFLSFVIGDTGLFRFSRHNSDYSISNLIEWTETKAINSFGQNQISVIAYEGELLFFINGELVGKAEDSRPGPSRVGLIILSSDSTQRVVYEFDNFALRTPN